MSTPIVVERRLLNIHDERHTSQHPFTGTRLGLQLGAEDKGGASELRLVGGAHIHACGDIHLVRSQSLDVDNRHLAEHLLRLGAFKDAAVDVPASTLNVQAGDVGTIARGTFHLLHGELLGDIRPGDELVQLPLVLLRCHLANCGEEGLRVV